jgi:hypothetical protein
MLDPAKFKIIARIIPLDPIKQQALNQAIAVGAFNPQLPPVVRRKVLELYQMPVELDQFSEDAKVQQKEIEGAKQSGQFPQPTIWQNDDTHMEGLTHWMNSDDFEKQPPQLQAAANQHFVAHLQNKATKLQIAGAMQGAHAEAGGQPEQQGQQSRENNPQFRHNRGVAGSAAKPNRSQPTAGNQYHVGSDVGMSHSAMQRRRNQGR